MLCKMPFGLLIKYYRDINMQCLSKHVTMVCLSPTQSDYNRMAVKLFIVLHTDVRREREKERMLVIQ